MRHLRSGAIRIMGNEEQRIPTPTAKGNPTLRSLKIAAKVWAEFKRQSVETDEQQARLREQYGRSYGDRAYKQRAMDFDDSMKRAGGIIDAVIKAWRKYFG